MNFDLPSPIIYINADFVDGSCIGKGELTDAPSKVEAFDSVSRFWMAILDDRHQEGLTTKTIAPPNWWYCETTGQVLDVKEWLEGDATRPTGWVAENQACIVTRENISQVLTAMKSRPRPQGF